MCKLILFCGLVVVAFAVAAQAVSPPAPTCGPNEAYFTASDCAPCGISCGAGGFPCKTKECLTGCQCKYGFVRNDAGKCIEACPAPPPGAVN